MAVKIGRRAEEPEGDGRLISREGVALTLDERVVPLGHARANTILVQRGGEVEPGDARRYGLDGADVPRDWEKRLGAG